MESNTFLHHHPGDKKEGMAAESDPISSLFSNRRKFLKTTGIIAGGMMLNQITGPFKNAEAAALAAPTNIIASIPGIGAVSFTWDPVSGATGYKIYTGTSTGAYTYSNNLGNVISANFTNLPSGTYYVAFTAYDGTGESGFSSELFFNIDFVPPQNIVYSASTSGAVSFTWDPVIGAAGYKLHHGTSSGSYPNTVDLGNVTSFSFSNISAETYYVALSSYKSNGTGSQKSGELVIAIPVTFPSSVGYSVIGSTVNLYWNRVYGAVGYVVYYFDMNVMGWKNIELGNVTSFSFSNIPAGEYAVFLASLRSDGEQVSGFATQVNITV